MVKKSQCDRPNTGTRSWRWPCCWLGLNRSYHPLGLFDPEAESHAYHSLMQRIRRHRKGIKGRFKPGKLAHSFLHTSRFIALSPTDTPNGVSPQHKSSDTAP